MTQVNTTMDGFWSQVLEDLGEVSKQHFVDYIGEAKESATQFLNDSRADIERYTQQYASKQLSQEEYTLLLKARLFGLSKMRALTELGISQIKLDHYRYAILDKLIELAFRFVDILVNSVVDKLGGKSLTTQQP